MTVEILEPSIERKKLWLAAIKPPMYSVAIMPIWWGTAIAFAAQKTIDWITFITFLVSAILILAWENISNDVFDSETGIDHNKAHSLVNLTQRKSLVFWLGNLCLGSGIAGVFAICYWQHDITVLGLILGCCGLGYLYQGPPFRLGYQGLGEVLCFFAFGPLAVGAAYYSQTQAWSLTAQFAAIVLGMTTSLILFCSHFHQVEDDAAAGKRSPIVRLGTERAAQLLSWFCGSIYGSVLLLLILRQFPAWTGLSFISLPLAFQLCQHVAEHHNQPNKVKNCKFIAVKLHFWTGLLFGLGFCF